MTLFYPIRDNNFFSDFLKEKLGRSGCKETILKFYLEVLIHHNDIELLIISKFWTVYVYVQSQFDNYFTVHGPGHWKFRPVEIFKLSITVSRTKAFIFIYF